MINIYLFYYLFSKIQSSIYRHKLKINQASRNKKRGSLTLSLLGYLKTRRGGQFDPPPSKSHVWCPNMTHDTSLESTCAHTFRIWKKICKFAKIEFFIAKSSYIVKMFAKRNLPKKWQIIHFWKALDHAISNMQKCLQNFK